MKDLAREALQVQDACNPIAVAIRFGAMITELRDQLALNVLPHDTSAMRSHPIFCLWVSKLYDMGSMGISDFGIFNESWDSCERLSKVE